MRERERKVEIRWDRGRDEEWKRGEIEGEGGRDGGMCGR